MSKEPGITPRIPTVRVSGNGFKAMLKVLEDTKAEDEAKMKTQTPGITPTPAKCPTCSGEVHFDLISDDAQGIVARCSREHRFPLNNGLPDCLEFFPDTASLVSRVTELEKALERISLIADAAQPGKKAIAVDEIQEVIHEARKGLIWRLHRSRKEGNRNGKR